MITAEQSRFPLVVHKVVEKYCMQTNDVIVALKASCFANHADDIDEALDAFSYYADNVKRDITADLLFARLLSDYTLYYPDADFREESEIYNPCDHDKSDPICTASEHGAIIKHFMNTPSEEIIPELQRYIDAYIGIK